MRALLLSLPVLLLAACGPNRTLPERGDYQPPGVTPLTCLPNLDGRIDASELQTALGVPVAYLASPSGLARTVDVAGQVGADGVRQWDLGTDWADDQVARIAAAPLAGRWYAASFPAGQFVTPLDLSGRTEAVYTNDGSALLLLGFASAQEAPPEGKTLVVYTSPIALFRFPLQVGAQWVSTSEVRNATLRGLPYAARDTYQVSVDGSGRLLLPDVTFTQALRVRTAVTIEPAVGAPVSRKQVSFLFECFGEVARAQSVDGETKDDFTTTAELRRLGF